MICLSFSPSLPVFQPPRVPLLVQELQGFLAFQALQQVLGAPVALVLQWLFLEGRGIPQILAPLVPPWHPFLLENHGHPDREQDVFPFRPSFSSHQINEVYCILIFAVFHQKAFRF